LCGKIDGPTGGIRKERKGRRLAAVVARRPRSGVACATALGGRPSSASPAGTSQAGCATSREPLKLDPLRPETFPDPGHRRNKGFAVFPGKSRRHRPFRPKGRIADRKGRADGCRFFLAPSGSFCCTLALNAVYAIVDLRALGGVARYMQRPRRAGSAPAGRLLRTARHNFLVIPGAQRGGPTSCERCTRCSKNYPELRRSVRGGKRRLKERTLEKWLTAGLQSRAPFPRGLPRTPHGTRPVAHYLSVHGSTPRPAGSSNKERGRGAMPSKRRGSTFGLPLGLGRVLADSICSATVLMGFGFFFL